MLFLIYIISISVLDRCVNPELVENGEMNEPRKREESFLWDSVSRSVFFGQACRETVVTA